MCFCPAESHCTPVSVMSICMGSVMYINYVCYHQYNYTCEVNKRTCLRSIEMESPASIVINQDRRTVLLVFQGIKHQKIDLPKFYCLNVS